MPMRRDPLSVQYDGATTRVLLAAIRAHQSNPKQPRAARIWVHSPARQFRELDRGGRTANERALTRAIYYRTWRVPINLGVTPQWSPDLTWSKVENHRGRWGRYLKVRLYRHGSGKRKADAKRRDQQWRRDEGTWATGGQRSVPWDRIDSNRKQAG